MTDNTRLGAAIVDILSRVGADVAEATVTLEALTDTLQVSGQEVAQALWTDDEHQTPAAAAWHAVGWRLVEDRMFSHDALVFKRQ